MTLNKYLLDLLRTASKKELPKTGNSRQEQKL
jgi:hypothetical protein